MSSPESIPSESAVQFLWNNHKLKSRDCFLQISEFITPMPNDDKMPVLKNLLICLRPTGKEFFEGYILEKNQFIQIVDKFTEYYNEHLLPFEYI